MAWYRRSSKLFSQVFRCKISQSIFRVNYIGQWKTRPFDAKRFYSAAPHHQSCTDDAKRRKVVVDANGIMALFIALGLPIVAFANESYGPHETTPYTLRRHFVSISRNKEKEVGEIQIDQIKKKFKGKVVDPLHPDSIKVQSILHYIIEALQRGFSNDNNLPEDPIKNDPRFEIGLLPKEFRSPLPEDMKNCGYNVKNDLVEDKWDNEDLVLDYKWVHYRRKIARYHGMSLDGRYDCWLMAKNAVSEVFEWEVVVVDEPDVVDAFCLPGGKIVVFTGLLKHFETPSEIAAIIGHQVGHAVSRHHAKQVTRENQWLIIKRIFSPDIVKTLSDLFLIRHPFSPREEMEADSIGLLLAACAGYDPRVAPRVYEKLATFGGDYDATHCSGKKRAQLLAQAKVMENAIYIYDKVREGERIQGFLNYKV